MGLRDRLIKNSKISKTSGLEKSDVFTNRTKQIPTRIYALNVALSGSLFGGLTEGELITLSAESKHFKSLFGLIMVESYLRFYKDDDPVCIFYDSEGGSAKTYFNAIGIDETQVIRTPLKNIEQLKFDIMSQLNDIVENKDRVIIFIDSVGNLASVKEATDALTENSAQDMSRPKALKALGRLITPELDDKKVPCIVINHVYDSIGPFAKKIMGGGQGLMLSSNSVFFITKAQEKEGSDLAGYTFTLVAEKSRNIKEKSKIPITVKFDKGIDIYTGLLDIAQNTGHVIKPNQGWYSRVIDGVVEDKKWRAKDTSTKEFWQVLLDDPSFDEGVGKLYKLGTNDMFATDPSELSEEEIIDQIDD